MALVGVETASFQRFEFKYLISEPQAELVRAFAQSYLCPDSHVDTSHNNEYPVHSLYLDSADLWLYSRTVAGEKNRFKLRVRCYDDRPDTPAFAEIKARKNDVIQKQRAPVRKECVERILGSFCVSSDDLVKPSASDLGVLDRFCELCATLWARPKVFVRYQREAYVDSAGRPVRLTMDRHVTCLRTVEPALVVDRPGWVPLPERRVVLEIKFTDTFPAWAHEMARAVGLRRTSAAKYVRSVDALLDAGVGVV